MFEFFIISFIIGGINITLVTYLAKKYSTKLAALIYALPIQFLITAFIIIFSNDKDMLFELSYQSIYSVFVIIVFLNLLNFLLKFFNLYLSISLSLLSLILLLSIQILIF